MRDKGHVASIHERIALLIKQFEAGNKSAFARAIKLSTGALADIIGGRLNNPSFDVLTKILGAYPLVNPTWLVTGGGAMYLDQLTIYNEQDQPSPENLKRIQPVAQEEQAPTYGRGLQVLTVQVGADNEENIELVSTRAAAGYARHGRIEREFIRELPHFRLPDPAYQNGSFRCFQVSGDSMQSTLYDRDWVICRFVERWDRDIRDTRVYVVVTAEEVLVKRLGNRLGERGELTLHSDNAAYPVQFLDGQQVREVWEAVGKLSRQFVNPRYDTSRELSRQAETLEELLRRVDNLEKGNK